MMNVVELNEALGVVTTEQTSPMVMRILEKRKGTFCCNFDEELELAYPARQGTHEVAFQEGGKPTIKLRRE